MKKITVANRKGGTGKTSTAGNIAWELAKTHRTVLIDADPQGSLTSWLHRENGHPYELADVLNERCPLHKALVPLYPGLHLLPTFIDGDLREYAEVRAAAEPYAFSDLADALAATDFQCLVVDIAPGIGVFEKSVIAAMDRALLILEPEYLSIDGMAGLLGDMEEVIRKRRAHVAYDMLVVNRVNRNFTRHRMYLQALQEKWTGYQIYPVNQGAAVSEAQTVHLPLELYAPRDERALPGYQEIARALKEEM